MTDDRSLPKTFDDAIEAGYKRFEDLPQHVRDLVQAHDKTKASQFDLVIGSCGPGHSGPCSTTNYPDGTRKVCYCTAAKQCDDCAFEQAGG
jgi:hypothetical protein